MPTSSKTRSEIKNGWGTSDSGPMNAYEIIHSANFRFLVDNTKWIDEGVDNIEFNVDVITVTYADTSTLTINLPKYVNSVSISDGVMTFKDVSGNVLATSPKFATYAQLQDEKTQRESADTTLQTDLTSEVAAREAGDTTQKNYTDGKIAAEQLARNNADSALQTNIDTEKNQRLAKDAELAAAIEQEADDRAAAIYLEAQARNASDVLLQQNIDAEATTRAQSDQVLQTSINNETSHRVNNDAILQQNIDAEATARQNADIVMQGNIDDEVVNRDTAIATAIDGLKTVYLAIKKGTNWVFSNVEDGLKVLSGTSGSNASAKVVPDRVVLDAYAGDDNTSTINVHQDHIIQRNVSTSGVVRVVMKDGKSYYKQDDEIDLQAGREIVVKDDISNINTYTDTKVAQEKQERVAADDAIDGRLDVLEAWEQDVVFDWDDTAVHELNFDEVSFLIKPNGSTASGKPTWQIYAKNNTSSSIGIGSAGYYEYDAQGSQQYNFYEIVGAGAESQSFDVDSLGLGYGAANRLTTADQTVCTSLGSLFDVKATCPSFATSGTKKVIFTCQRISYPT